MVRSAIYTEERGLFVVGLTLTSTIKSVVEGQAPLNLQNDNTPEEK